MKLSMLAALVALLTLMPVVPTFAQDWANPPGDTQTLFPIQISPGRFEQVPQDQIQALAQQGWELVSVVPYVYMNEERGPEPSNRPMVTQVYLAYSFKRTRKYGDLYPPYEVMSVFPIEGPPAMYTQVDQGRLQALAAQGWTLVAVVPFTIKNEERGPEPSNRPLVTQTYPAYFLRRVVLSAAPAEPRP